MSSLKLGELSKASYIIKVLALTFNTKIFAQTGIYSAF